MGIVSIYRHDVLLSDFSRIISPEGSGDGSYHWDCRLKIQGTVGTSASSRLATVGVYLLFQSGDEGCERSVPCGECFLLVAGVDLVWVIGDALAKLDAVYLAAGGVEPSRRFPQCACRRGHFIDVEAVDSSS